MHLLIIPFCIAIICLYCYLVFDKITGLWYTAGERERAGYIMGVVAIILVIVYSILLQNSLASRAKMLDRAKKMGKLENGTWSDYEMQIVIDGDPVRRYNYGGSGE